MRPWPKPDIAGPGQESVWDYPRPPRLADFAGAVTIELGGQTIASTTAPGECWRPATRRRITCPAPRSLRARYGRRPASHGVNGRGGRATSTWWPQLERPWVPRGPTSGRPPIRADRGRRRSDGRAGRPLHGQRRGGGPPAGGFYGGWITSWIVGRSRASPDRGVGERPAGKPVLMNAGIMLSVDQMIAAPPHAAWELLIDLDAWPQWGPSIKGAELDGPYQELTSHATGVVQTSLGVKVLLRSPISTPSDIGPGKWRASPPPVTGWTRWPTGSVSRWRFHGGRPRT